ASCRGADRAADLRTPTGRPAGRPVYRVLESATCGVRCLPLVVQSHLELLAGTERGSDRRLDLNRPTRLRVAAHARGALAGLEVAEPGDLHLRALLQFARDDALVVEQGVNRASGIGLRHLGAHGQCRGQLSFVHAISLWRSRAGESLDVSPLFSGGRPKSLKSRHNMGYPPEKPQDTGTSLTHPPRETTLPPRCQTPRRHVPRTPRATWRLGVEQLEVCMFHGTRPGWIEVISGVMFAGKGEELLRRVRRGGSAR